MVPAPKISTDCLIMILFNIYLIHYLYSILGGYYVFLSITSRKVKNLSDRAFQKEITAIQTSCG